MSIVIFKRCILVLAVFYFSLSQWIWTERERNVFCMDPVIDDWGGLRASEMETNGKKAKDTASASPRRRYTGTYHVPRNQGNMYKKLSGEEVELRALFGHKYISRSQTALPSLHLQSERSKTRALFEQIIPAAVLGKPPRNLRACPRSFIQAYTLTKYIPGGYVLFMLLRNSSPPSYR